MGRGASNTDSATGHLLHRQSAYLRFNWALHMSTEKRQKEKIQRTAKSLLKQNPGLDGQQLGAGLRLELLRIGMTWDTETIEDAVDRAIHPEYYSRPKPGCGWS